MKSLGILKTDTNTYVFAAIASDVKPQGAPAGPRVRDTVIEIFKKMGLSSE